MIMLNVTLICVGKSNEKYYTEAVDEYAKRLAAFCRFELREVPETRLSQNPSQGEIAAALNAEYRRMKIPDRAFLCALCVEGKSLSSEAFARQLENLAVSGTSQLCFVIGGSFGLAEAVKQRADLKLSMGPMTFPHALARVMFTEQLYRAFSINAGSKYHK